MNIELFLSTFSLVFIAEIPDKTAMATLMMATQGRPVAIFIGVATAFVIQNIVIVTFGSAFSLLPKQWVHLATGVLFILFAVLSWRKKIDKEEFKYSTSGHTDFLKTVCSSFLVIFIAEWGDLTQLATASLAAKYPEPITIFCSATLSLWTITAVAILIGNRAKKALKPNILKAIGTITFACVGMYFLISWFKT